MLTIGGQCQIANCGPIDRCYVIVIPLIKDISRLASEDTNYKSHGRYVCYISTLEGISRYKYQEKRACLQKFVNLERDYQ